MTHFTKKALSLFQAIALTLLIGLGSFTFSPAVSAADDLTPLSDEFDGGLNGWSRLYQIEGGADFTNQLSVQDGELFVQPNASTWYEWRKGFFMFKEVTGDFIFQTKVRVSNRADNGAPASAFSLAGPMVRAPNANDWTFLTIGTGDVPGQYKSETKLTTNGVSDLILAPSGNEYEIAIVRIGSETAHLKRAPGGSWEVHRRYATPHLPTSVQVGLIAYTDWPAADAQGGNYGNSADIGGNPDLNARFDYARFSRPTQNAGSLSQMNDSQLVSMMTSQPAQDTPAVPADEPVVPEDTPSDEPLAPEPSDDVIPVSDDQDLDPIPPSVEDDDQNPQPIEPPLLEICPYTFSDISGHWAEGYIKTLCAKGVVQGKTPTTFDPDANVTRAEMTKIALEAFNVALSDLFTNPFIDVLAQEWFAKYVQTAKDEGIVNGYPDGTFKPNNNVTRAEALAVLTRAAEADLGSSASALLGCSDVKVGDWHISVLSWAYDNNVIDGGNCRPNDPMTRAEVAKVTVLMMEMAN